MNYTAAVKQYCIDYAGTILDVAYVHEHFFPLINYRTFLKILKRLESDGIIIPIAKGVYSIGAVDIDIAILDFYTANFNGMIIGDKLFSELGLISQVSPHVDIYTNRLPSSKSKNVKNYRLTGVDLVFDKTTVRLITLLELIENRSKLVNLNQIAYMNARHSFAGSFPEETLEEVARAIPYQAGTIELVRTNGGRIIGL